MQGKIIVMFLDSGFEKKDLSEEMLPIPACCCFKIEKLKKGRMNKETG